MAMSILIPSGSGQLIGPGQVVTVQGMTSAAAGHKLELQVNLPSGGPTLCKSGSRVSGSSGSQAVQIGVYGAGFQSTTSQLSITSGLTYLATQGTTVTLFVVHSDASSSILEFVNLTGYLWAPDLALNGLLAIIYDKIGGSSSDITDIRNAVLTTYSNA